MHDEQLDYACYDEDGMEDPVELPLEYPQEHQATKINDIYTSDSKLAYIPCASTHKDKRSPS